jgi:putative hydrolase of the HAD superfamily
MIKTVIFDLGGVLVRTDNKEPRTKLAEKFDMSYEDLSALVYGCESAEMATRGEITAEEHKETVLRELEFIKSLRGEYRTVLLSNAWDDLRDMLINLWEIDGIFDQIFISAELKIYKPDPEIFQKVIESLDQDPAELLFIDDFTKNIEAAREAGINAIQFINREQALAELAEYLDLEL